MSNIFIHLYIDLLSHRSQIYLRLKFVLGKYHSHHNMGKSSSDSLYLGIF